MVSSSRRWLHECIHRSKRTELYTLRFAHFITCTLIKIFCKKIKITNKTEEKEAKVNISPKNVNLDLKTHSILRSKVSQTSLNNKTKHPSIKEAPG